MPQAMPFRDVLDAADQLSADEQETLVSILRRRLAEEGRKRVAAEIQEARQEFATGGCRPATAQELLDEIQS
jgi:hypothetical protein